MGQHVQMIKMPDYQSYSPFEFHITIDRLALSEQSAFIEFCLTRHLKPIFIELGRGIHTEQPMLSKVVYMDSLSSALKWASVLFIELKEETFRPLRLKIEIPIQYFEWYRSDEIGTTYFEWHGKINFINTLELHKLCDMHHVHLSRNALKGQHDYRFITLREYGDKDHFESRLLELKHALEQGNWVVIKEQSEYCVYDSNVRLDDGWLINEQ